MGSCARLRSIPSGGLVFLLGIAVSGCSAADKESFSGSAGYNPWVQGGQTGALVPACGLTDAAVRGETIPGGADGGGVVVSLGGCVADVSALLLVDGEGTPVDVDVEQLDDDTVLLRPRVELQAGVYMLEGLLGGPAPVRVAAPAELPDTLGTLVPQGPSCGASFDLLLDQLALEYLPQLKLEVSIDGGPPMAWFDYGALVVDDAGRANVGLPRCDRCLADGTHELEVVAQLAGELGTLEPVTVSFAVDCSSANGAAPAGPTSAGEEGGCRASGVPGVEPPWASVLGVALALTFVGRRRRRREGVG